MPIYVIFLCFLATVFAFLGYWRRAVSVPKNDQASLMYLLASINLVLSLLYYPEVNSFLLLLIWWAISIGAFLSATGAAIAAWQVED